VRCIYILPIGPIDGAVLRTVAQEIRLRLDYQCTIIQNLGDPAYAFEASREQYSSGRILKEILKNKRLCANSKSTVKVLGIVDVDLCTPILTFVFGEAQLGGTAAIVSLCRLRQKFYGLPPDPDLLLIRAQKEALHELGHTFGLVHCSNPRCVMYFSNSVRNIDVKTNNFCDSCAMLLSEKKRRVPE
jgi:archaemetzincin